MMHATVASRRLAYQHRMILLLRMESTYLISAPSLAVREELLK
jgi:hypothetical protein